MVNSLFEPPVLGTVLSLNGLPGGGSKIQDRSAYGQPGTITGATWSRLPSGLWVLDFDGTDDKVAITNNAGLNLTGDITFMAWVNRSRTTTTESIMGKGAGNDYTQQYNLQVANNNKIYAVMGNAAGAGYFLVHGSDSTVGSGTMFLAWTLANLTSTLYKNGAVFGATGSTSGTRQSNVTDFDIGDRVSGQPWLGMIALPRLFGRALPAAEIASIFNQEKHLFGVW